MLPDTRYDVDMLDSATLSHVLLWVIGLMTVCATVMTIGALCMMGRTGYRKD